MKKSPERPMTTHEKFLLEKKRKAFLAEQARRTAGLPHLYGWKWYTWARAFFNSRNRINLLCAANQISKSSTQIRKCIDWATDQKKWPELWRTTPKIFWYLYPSNEVATVEFEKKWVPEFMPRAEFKDDPVYGWDVEYKGKFVVAIHFKSGVTVYFHTYAQGAKVLQTASVHAVFADEEMPESLYDEINARLIATDGYFHMVFTATLNQDMWQRALEGTGDTELFPTAFKLQVSMYDCLFYDDGTPSHWTEEKIKQIEGTCKSKTEVQRRVMGKFVTEIGRKYPAFDPTRHYRPAIPIPADWRYYSGVDLGTGGATGHPAAVVFVAISPDNRLGYICHGWRGDGVQTTAGDVLVKYQELRGLRNMADQRYDWHSKDFGIIATRAGEAFNPAQKSHEFGEEVVNTLFKNDMLFIFDNPELRKLGAELTSLQKKTAKTSAKDDFSDAARYALTAIPWDWNFIKSTEISSDDETQKEAHGLTEEEFRIKELDRRRGKVTEPPAAGWAELEDDIAFWNEAYG